MKRFNLKVSGTYILLVVLALAAVSAHAGKDKCSDPNSSHPSCGDGSSGGGGSSGGETSLVANFCLNMSTVSTAILPDANYQCTCSDGNDYDYCHDKREKVNIATGTGPGFRFDTNSGKASVPPVVYVDFGAGVQTWDTSGSVDMEASVFNSGDYEMDFRFHLASGGLELADLANAGDSGTVPIRAHLSTLDGSQKGDLYYGVGVPEGNPQLDGNPCLPHTAPAIVTYLGGGSYSIQSDNNNNKACLWDNDFGFDGQDGTLVESMPFYFEIAIDN